MLKKLGKKITNNFGLKILAALLAFILWIVVINIDDPTTAKKYTTNVTTENTSFITAQNKYYEPLNGNNTITFSVSAERSIHDVLSGSDFSATADMEKIEYDEESETYRVPVTITPNRYSNKVSIVSKNLYLEVALEDLGTCQKAISATTRGNVADGCALGEVQIVGSNLLKISGPYSVVSQIDRVEAAINVEGMSTDVTDTVVPVLYDADDNVIDTTKLTMSLSTVTISAQILNTKDVALEFHTMGEAAEGYVLMGVDYSLDTVRIKGEAATLNTVNKISIPKEVLDISGITENLETTVDITSYLPSGTSLVLNSDAKVEVTVKVEPIVTENIVIPVGNLTIENLQDGYTARIDSDTVTVAVSGAKSEVEAVDADGLKGVINASGLGEGEHHLAVEFTLEGEHCWIDSVRVPVTITGAGDEEEEEEASGGQTTNTSGTGTAGAAGGASGSATTGGASGGGTSGNTTGGTSGNNTTGGTSGNTTGGTSGNTTTGSGSGNTSSGNTTGSASGSTGNEENAGTGDGASDTSEKTGNTD